jgi:putative PIN family toxin of toxin-antitoxin system
VRVFLDTNVLVSAFATRGLSADVLRLVLSEHELVTGEIVLDELRRVLTEKIRLPEAVLGEALDVLHEHHVEPTAEPVTGIDIADPSDALVLATALEAGAEVLVSGDRDLLDVAGEVTSLRILDPRSFWEQARG